MNVSYFITFFCCLLVGKGESISLHEFSKTSTGKFKYHTYEDMLNFLNTTSAMYSDFTHLYSIGRSVLNKTLWVLEISAAPKSQLGIPSVKLIGNIHGNEPLGKEMILLLAEYILSQYKSNKRIQWLMGNTRIHLLPSANPDGFEKARMHCDELSGSRNNIRDVDINANFPKIFGSSTIPRQEETKAIIKWLNSVPFLLSGSLHSSALVVTYPYDSKPQNITEEPSLTPDDDVFKYIASVYASTHPRMHKDSQCPRIQKKFHNGTINGGEWLSKAGTMQDYNYVFHRCMELSLVISCCRYPQPEKLSFYWDENRESLLKFLSHVHMGIRGVVFNIVTNETISNVKLKIDGRNSFNSTQRGEFWRILLPGKYRIQASVAGYRTNTLDFEVKENTENELQMTWINITMHPCPIKMHQTLKETICDEMISEKIKSQHHSYETQTESFHIDYHITLPTLYEAKANDVGQSHQERMQIVRDNAPERDINCMIMSFVIAISSYQFILHL